MEVERLKAKIVKYCHPWGDFMTITTARMLVFMEYPQGVPHGYIATLEGKIALPAWDFSIFLEARITEKVHADICIAKKGNVTYVYVPYSGYLMRFVDFELEYDVKDADNYYESIYPREVVDDIEQVKEGCNSAE